MKKHELARLSREGPARLIGTSRRALTGKVRVEGGRAVGFESSLERDWQICLDFDPCVRQILEQPFSIFYPTDGGERRYTPDMLAEYCLGNGDSSVVVYEVKHIEELREEWQKYRRRFTEAVRHCRERGWRFKIVTERHIRTPYLQNAKFLRKYRVRQEQTLFKDQLLYSLKALGRTTPQALLAFSYLHDEKRMAALTELWRMVAKREVFVDLDELLTMNSPLWIEEQKYEQYP